MNKEIFTALCEHIKKNVPEIRWIDFDTGQLNIASERPPVDWPCCLIDISYPSCRDLAVEDNMHASRRLRARGRNASPGARRRAQTGAEDVRYRRETAQRSAGRNVQGHRIRPEPQSRKQTDEK